MQFANDTYLAAFGERSVVLDLLRDRYVGLNRRLTGIALAVASARADRADASAAAALETLVREGVVSADSQQGEYVARLPPPQPPTDTYWPSRRFGLGLNRVPRQCISALWSLAAVKHSLERRKFVDTIGWLRRRHSHSGRPRSSISAEELIDAFYAARPWFPVKPICRLDAPALCLHLWRHGYNASLVFGVRIDPFAAHCWAQLDNSALQEPADRLQQFTAIMSA